MDTLMRYCFFQYKKGLKILSKTVISLMGMLLVLAAGIFAASHIFLQAQMFEVLNVGMVIPHDDQQMALVTRFIATVDSVKSVCRFQYLSEDEALSQLDEGKLEAVIVLPDHFIEDINCGKNTPATVYFPYHTTFNTQIFTELLESGLSYLQTAEAGVYASLKTAEENSKEVQKENIGDFIAGKYAALIMKREGMFNEQLLSPMGKMTVYQYYFTVLIIFFIVMSGLNMGPLYQRQNKLVEQKLRLYGIGRFKTAMVKVLVMTSCMWLLGGSVYIISCAAAAFKGDGMIWFEWRSLLGLLPVCLATAVYSHIVYSACKSSTQGIVVLLMTNIFMFLCSGMAVPLTYMPKTVQVIGDYVPMRFWNRYCENVLFGQLSMEEGIIAVLMILIGLGIGAGLAWKE